MLGENAICSSSVVAFPWRVTKACSARSKCERETVPASYPASADIATTWSIMQACHRLHRLRSKTTRNRHGVAQFCLDEKVKECFHSLSFLKHHPQFQAIVEAAGDKDLLLDEADYGHCQLCRDCGEELLGDKYQGGAEASSVNTVPKHHAEEEFIVCDG